MEGRECFGPAHTAVSLGPRAPPDGQRVPSAPSDSCFRKRSHQNSFLSCGLPRILLVEGFCECGCGEPTRRFERTVPSRGEVAGEFARFKRGHWSPRFGPVRERVQRPCACGCGRLTFGVWALGHNPYPESPGKNPDRKCFCGCGGETAHKNARYIQGHRNRKSAVEYVVDDAGCWVWQLGMGSKGYGCARRDGVQIAAHRFVYERERGDIPADMELHHVCGNRRCVNPEHLEPLSKAEHAARHWRERAESEQASADALASTQPSPEAGPAVTAPPPSAASLRACTVCQRPKSAHAEWCVFGR